MAMHKGSLEKTRLVVPNVKVKKSMGKLRLQSDSVIWTSDDNPSVTVVVKYADVKLQRISADAKDKVQLQLVQRDDESQVFHFVNPGGKDAQLSDRNSTRDVVSEVLLGLARLDKELEEKKKMLADDQQLYERYVSLVSTGILDAEEFWTGQPKVGIASLQEVGVSSTIASVIVRHSDRGVVHSLSDEIKAGIFRTYPELAKKYGQCVPAKMEDGKFWEEYLQSSYFLLDDKMAADRGLLAGCLAEDERRVRREFDYIRAQPTRDHRMLQDCHPDSSIGAYSMPDSCPGQKACSLIERLNMHSALVLRTAMSTDKSSPAAGDEKETKARGVKRKAIDEDNDDQPVLVGRPLKISKIEPYRLGPAAQSTSTSLPKHEAEKAARLFIGEIEAWQPTPMERLFYSGNDGMEVIDMLVPSKLAAKNNGNKSNGLRSEVASEELLQQMKVVQSDLLELLKQFWSCFPVTGKEKEDRLQRMVESLRKFQKMKVFSISKTYSSHQFDFDPAERLNGMIQKAYDAFDARCKRRSIHRF